MTKLHIILLCLLLTLTTACSGLPVSRSPVAPESKPTLQAGRSTPSSTPQLIQYTNSGTVCFEKAEKLTDIKGYITTECLSFCASHIANTSLVVVVDSNRRTIRFDTRFVLETEPDKPVHPCLTVCEYGKIEFAAQNIGDGAYKVGLGNKVIGELVIPLEKTICLEDR